MKCKICRDRAVISLPQHNLALCEEHFLARHARIVLDTVKKFRMFGPDDRVAVAVSGGKDSLGLLQILVAEGVSAFGVFIDLGLGEFQAMVNRAVEGFAIRFNAEVVRYSLAEHHGRSLPELVAGRKGQMPCSFCGTLKRYLMNRVALENGATVLATGHNLNDETAVLLANALRWDTPYLARQNIVLASTHPKLLRKVKPLAFLTEKETGAYALLRGIGFVRESCPYSQGARSLWFKRVMAEMEAHSPGTKLRFYKQFLRFRAEHLAREAEAAMRECESCGFPTTNPVCAFCRIVGEGQRP